VLILGGTTAAGKSDLAIELSERYGAAIVSADAMTVFRGMDVGTAKPSAQVLERIPHACVDVVEPDEPFSVADFVDSFEATKAANQNVLVVGGTPFYLAALVRPMADMPAADPEIRAELEALEVPHERLSEVDPESAARLHPNDRVRVIRALEVHAITGRTMTELHAQGGRTLPVQAAIAWLDSDDLDARISQRLQQMAESGYADEVRRLLQEGYGPQLRPMRAFAYRHIVEHVQDGLEFDEALRRTGRDTRRFARKQRTWARGMNWRAVTRDEVLSVAKTEFARE